MLIQAAVNGDEPAFTELIRRYQSLVWGTVYRTLGNTSEAEDAVQEIFMRVLVSLKRFDRKYPFGPWILRIAGNYCIDRLRRKKTRKDRLWSELPEAEQRRIARMLATEPETAPAAPEEALQTQETAWILLDRLKPRRRMAFVLKVLEGHSYETVARILGVPQTTARVRVHRARADLHREYARYLATLNGES